jgi:hypothetical protein
MAASWVIELDRAGLDYAVLGTLALVALTAWLLFRVGLLGWALRLFGGVVRGSIRLGFGLWERLLSWAPWPLFLAVAVALLLAGGSAAAYLPGLTVACAVAALFMGVAACLAYMFIDLERYEVERGYKAVHNPLKGQELARHLVRYGHRVGVPLLAAAAVATVGGFALLNEGLYHSVGRDWYRLGEDEGPPGFADFLVNALLHLLRVVDVLDLASSHHLLNARYVRQAAWPASTLWAPSRRSLLWYCSSKSSPRSARGSCWPRRLPTSGVRTSRSTSGRATRCPSTGPPPSARCCCRCARSRP